MSSTGLEGSSVVQLILLLITLTLIGFFFYLVAINMRYIKELSYKIKIIMRAANESDSPLMKYKKMDKSNLNDTIGDPEIGPQPKNEANKQEVIDILKRMAEKGRSPRFKDILKVVFDKYNHLITWPFTRKSEEKKYDLLRPLSRFYHLLNVTGILILWTIIVFTIAIFYVYTDEIYLVTVLILSLAIGSPSIIVFIHVYYKVYMNNIKRVFAQAYYPDTFMKVDKDKDNSIEKAIPVDVDNDSKAEGLEKIIQNRPYESEKHIDQINELNQKSDSFHYDGGEEIKDSDPGIDSTNNQMLGREPVSASSGRIYSPEISDHPIFAKRQQESVSSNRSIGMLPDINSHRKIYQDKAELDESQNENKGEDKVDNDDYSVYEVISDDDLNDPNKNLGLVESESKGSQNLNSMISYIILFALLLFAAGICSVMIMYLSAAVAGTAILVLIISNLLDVLVVRNCI